MASFRGWFCRSGRLHAKRLRCLRRLDKLFCLSLWRCCSRSWCCSWSSSKSRSWASLGLFGHPLELSVNFHPLVFHSSGSSSTARSRNSWRGLLLWPLVVLHRWVVFDVSRTQDSRGTSHRGVESTANPPRAEKVEHALATADVAADGCARFLASRAQAVAALDEQILYVLVRDVRSTSRPFVTGFDLARYDYGVRQVRGQHASSSGDGSTTTRDVAVSSLTSSPLLHSKHCS